MQLYERLTKSLLNRLLKRYTFKYQTVEEDGGTYYYISDGTAVYRLNTRELLLNPKQMQNEMDNLIEAARRMNNPIMVDLVGCNSIQDGKVNSYIYITQDKKYEIHLQWDFLRLFEGLDYIAYDDINKICVIYREDGIMGYLKPVMEIKLSKYGNNENGYAAEVEPLQIEAPESRVEVYGK